MIEVERLAEVLVEVADTLIDDFDVVEFLESGQPAHGTVARAHRCSRGL